MTPEIRNTLIVLFLSCLCVIGWAGTAIGAYVDIRRRKLPWDEQIAWVALIVFVPGVGFIGYLLSHILAAYFAPPKKAVIPEKRYTEPYRVIDQDVRSGTIPALELISETHADQPAPASPYQFGTGDTDPRQIVTLNVMEGPHAGQTFVLGDLPATIGRENDSYIYLRNDLSVSRLHAEIYRKEGALRIRDLRSTYGTFVNGFSIDDKALEPGDKILVGDSLIRVEVD